jgi:hypothetical protein
VPAAPADEAKPSKPAPAVANAIAFLLKKVIIFQGQ